METSIIIHIVKLEINVKYERIYAIIKYISFFLHLLGRLLTFVLDIFNEILDILGFDCKIVIADCESNGKKVETTVKERKSSADASENRRGK